MLDACTNCGWAPHVTLGGHEDQAQTRTPRSTDLGKGSATWWYPHTVRVDKRIRGGAFCKSFDLHSAPCSEFRINSVQNSKSVAVTARSTSDGNHCGRANTLVPQYTAKFASASSSFVLRRRADVRHGPGEDNNSPKNTHHGRCEFLEIKVEVFCSGRSTTATATA